MARPGVQLLAACFLCATVESGDPQGLRGASRIGDRRGPGAVLDIPDSDAEDANSTAANTTEPLEGVVWVVEGPCRVSEDDGDCVESPNFPGGYGNGQRCAATLAGGETRCLEVLRYDVEPSYDGVRIDGAQALGLETTTITHRLEWSSDDSNVAGGWKICARALPLTTESSGPWTVFGPCELDTSDRNCVTSPNFPARYSNDEECIMVVRSDTTRYVDLVEYDVAPPHDTLLMGSEPVMDAQGREINDTIAWRSDKSQRAGGWKLCAAESIGGGAVWLVTGPCTVDAADEECVTSPSYPDEYGSREACTMSMAGPETRYLVVDRYEVEQGYDYLTVGGRLYDPRFDGRAIKGEITWTSDESMSAGGWRICARRAITSSTTTTRTFVLGSWYIDGPCEAAMEEGRQCVTSPNFPEEYGANLRCSLSIFGGGTRYLEVGYLDEASGYRADSLLMDGVELTHHDSGRPIGEVTWSSDAMTSVGGAWKLCALDAPRQEPGTWEWTGPCDLDPVDSECIMSPQFPGSYGAGDLRCSMWIYGGATRYLEIVRMDMTTGFPPLFMGGRPVFDDREGEAIHPVLSWSAADTGSDSVWKVCARREF